VCGEKGMALESVRNLLNTEVSRFTKEQKRKLFNDLFQN